ncbi:MAG TPA: hypothetical protein VFO69_00905 [Allosphingosinicella sp.]|nr:hypothetical protein [Allosphingosinicella sp.]
MPKKQSRYRPTSLLVGVSLCVSALLAAPVPAAAACQAGQAGCVLPVGTTPAPLPPVTSTPTSTPVYADVDDGGGGIGWLPILLGAAALAALYFLFLDDDGDEDDVPVSP